METYQILSLFLMFLFEASEAKITTLELKGELTLNRSRPVPVTSEIIQSLENETLQMILTETNLDRSCFAFLPEISPHADGNNTRVSYALTIKIKQCSFNWYLNNVSQILGVSSMSVQISSTLQGEFWEEPINSILIFAACGAVILTLLVTCVVILCQAHRADKQRKESSKPSAKSDELMPYDAFDRQNSHLSYAMDTMVMDVVPRRKSHANNASVIESWVSSQLGKSNIPRKQSTRDSGIVTTSSREPQKNKEHPDADTLDSNEPRLFGYKKVDGCMSVDLIPPSCRNAPQAAVSSANLDGSENNMSIHEETTSLPDDSQH